MFSLLRCLLLQGVCTFSRISLNSTSEFASDGLLHSGVFVLSQNNTHIHFRDWVGFDSDSLLNQCADVGARCPGLSTVN
jgi:hypothetical protein